MEAATETGLRNGSGRTSQPEAEISIDVHMRIAKPADPLRFSVWARLAVVAGKRDLPT